MAAPLARFQDLIAEVSLDDTSVTEWRSAALAMASGAKVFHSMIPVLLNGGFPSGQSQPNSIVSLDDTSVTEWRTLSFTA